MLRSVDFLSRANAEALPARDDHVMVSISEPEAPPACLALPEERILRLSFHDVDPAGNPDGTWQLFDEEQARSVMDFLDQIQGSAAPWDLLVHCRAGISRSAAVALFAEAHTGCAFPRRPFAGLANEHVLSVLGKVSGHYPSRPRALPRKERFTLAIQRDFHCDIATVTIANLVTEESLTREGPLLSVPDLVAQGLQQVWGVKSPPPSYLVSDWETLRQVDAGSPKGGSPLGAQPDPRRGGCRG